MLYLVCSSAGLCVRLAEAPATAVCGATAANTKGNKGAGACCTAAVGRSQPLKKGGGGGHCPPPARRHFGGFAPPRPKVPQNGYFLHKMRKFSSLREISDNKALKHPLPRVARRFFPSGAPGNCQKAIFSQK